MNYKKKNIKAIVLAGSRDFGRCPLASRLPMALWPVAGRPAIEQLLRQVATWKLKDVTICSNGDASLLRESIDVPNSMNAKFLDEQLPIGTAGCIRNAVNGQIEKDELLIVLTASMVSPPALDVLIKAHHSNDSDLTVLLNPPTAPGQPLVESADIYVCEPTILQYIPKEGYFDIKESLIPAILREGKNIHAVTLDRNVGNFRNHAGYLAAIAEYLQSADKQSFDLPAFRENGLQTLWTASDCSIDSSAKIYGPVVIMDRAAISRDCVIFGPTIIGRDAHIGQGSLIDKSVLWNGSQLGRQCQVKSCVLDNNAIIPNHTVIEQQAIAYKHKTILQNSASKVTALMKKKGICVFEPIADSWHKFSKLLGLPEDKKVSAWVLAALLSAVFIWSYWPQIAELWAIWQRSDEYSSGLLVPFLAVYILWSRREQIASCKIKPSLWGLAALLGAVAFRYFGLFFMYGSAERLSVVMSIAALVLMLLGWQLFRKVSTTLLFLCLMLPLPRTIHARVMLPLQSWATSSAVFCLEILGYAVVQEGNVIHLSNTTVAVAEACNGLRMIMAFFVISGLVVLLVRRPPWQKLIVLSSSLPIGLICNSVRLTITAIAFTILSGEYWEKVFHDFGGYAMMPVALAMVVLELWLLQKIVTVPTEKQIIVAGNSPR